MKWSRGVAEGDKLALPVGAGVYVVADFFNILRPPAVPVDDAVELVVEIGVVVELIHALLEDDRLSYVIYLHDGLHIWLD